MTQLLSAYILLFDEYNEKKASAQKDILIRILDDGVNKLNEAQKSLLQVHKVSTTLPENCWH